MRQASKGLVVKEAEVTRIAALTDKVCTICVLIIIIMYNYNV